MTLPEFDWCHFCEHDDWRSGNNKACRECVYNFENKPSHFKEKKSVKAYREALSATVEM